MKTNAMRRLEKSGIQFDVLEYDSSRGAVDGIHVANELFREYATVFKTLVTVSDKSEYFVFMIPVDCELNLKSAAKAVGVKAISMLPSKDILTVTGYMRGGCSPIGMKKEYPTIIHESAASLEKIMFSGGKIGYQVELKMSDLSKVLNFKLEDIIKHQ